MRVNGEIIFSVSCAVDKAQAEYSNMKIFEYTQDKWARELGMKIAKEKGWIEWEEDGRLMSEIRLYVFTPRELKDFLDLRLEHKLKEMGISEDTRSGRHPH